MGAGPDKVQLKIEQSFYLDESFSVPQIEELLNNALLSGGKRLRPQFTKLMGQLLGLDFSVVKRCALASELTHAAFLAHDDVVDEAYVRRGVQTINSRADNKRAVLAGDALLARVCEIVLEEPSREIMRDLAWAIRQVVDGEWLQLESIGIAPLELSHIEDVGFRKTGALLVWCARAAAHLSESDEATLSLCSDLGRLLGVAFQLTDDIIDYLPSAGKAYAKDYNQGLVNSVTCIMMQSNPALIDDFCTRKVPIKRGEEPWLPEVLNDAIDVISTRANLKLSLAINCVQKIYQKIASPKPLQSDARDLLVDMLAGIQSRKV